ncbi:Chemokine-like factor [Camelus dromedarius]|uniref:Chemokine-like factor n=1 Tax=Camelus dromedarius TaxID=9838 RepID=A0A5N4DRX9_CAMDR|nr:Chemokine-like factor [Camelus dromedarius]
MPTLKQKPKQRPFCFSVKGHVKILRLVLTVTSMTFFIIAQAPEPYIVITGFEVTIIFFFIVLYTVRLDRLVNCVFWPLLVSVHRSSDTVFLFQVFGLAASVFCIADGALIYRKLLFNPSGPYQKTAVHDRF